MSEKSFSTAQGARRRLALPSFCGSGEELQLRGGCPALETLPVAPPRSQEPFGARSRLSHPAPVPRVFCLGTTKVIPQLILVEVLEKNSWNIDPGLFSLLEASFYPFHRFEMEAEKGLAICSSQNAREQSCDFSLGPSPSPGRFYFLFFCISAL